MTHTATGVTVEDNRGDTPVVKITGNDGHDQQITEVNDKNGAYQAAQAGQGGSAKTRLNRRQQKFADILLADDQTTATAAYKEAYGVANTQTAEVNASRLLSSAKVLIYLNDNAVLAEHRIVELMQQRSDSKVALSAAQDILDRVHGRATNKTENTTTVVTLNVDLSGTLSHDS